MRRDVLALLSLFISAIILAWVLAEAVQAHHPIASACEKTYAAKHGFRASRAVYRSPTRVTRREKRQLRKFRRCARNHRAARRMIRRVHWWQRWRGSDRGYWRLAAERLSSTTRAGLANLRGCETRGIPFPSNYRYNGSSGYDGAYQYDGTTWGEAQSWRATPARHRTARAHEARKDQQDAVTAAFYPSHASRWPNCSY